MTEPSKRHGLDTNELDAWRQRTRPDFTHDVAVAKIEQARQGANPDWLVFAENVVRFLAATGPDTFTVDDVHEQMAEWAELADGDVPTTPKGQALGFVMRKLSQAHIIEWTGEFVPSRRKQSQRQPIRSWRRGQAA